MPIMTPRSKCLGPELNTNTVARVRQAGFEVSEVENIFLDIVKTIVKTMTAKKL